MFSSIQRAVAHSGQTWRSRTTPDRRRLGSQIQPRKRTSNPRSPLIAPLTIFRRTQRTQGTQACLLARLHHRNPLRYRRQRRELRVRRGLIPIPHRVEVIPAIVGVTMLHGVLHVPLEGHRIVAVPPVAAVLPTRPLRIPYQRRTVLPSADLSRPDLAAEIPAPQEI